MAASIGSRTYAILVAEAEAAVAAVKDPELRRVAFDRILATLLEAKQPAEGRRQKAIRAQTKAKASRVSDDAPSSKRGPKAYIEQLIADGFFKKQKTIAEVKAELANGGHHIAMTSLSGPLQSLTQQRKLRRQKLAARDGAKSTYAYSNW